MNISDVIKDKLKINCTLKPHKLSAEQLNLFKEKFGFELVAIPSLNDLSLNEDYFKKRHAYFNRLLDAQVEIKKVDNECLL